LKKRRNALFTGSRYSVEKELDKVERYLEDVEELLKESHDTRLEAWHDHTLHFERDER